MTRITTSTLTIAAILGTSGLLAVFATPLLAGPDRAQTPAASNPAQVQALTATATVASAPQFAPGRDGQRTVRVVYAGPTTTR